MKRCPTCHRTYPENSAPFCVEDGATLADEPYVAAPDAFRASSFVNNQPATSGALDSFPVVPAKKFLSLKTIGILAAVGLGLIVCVGLGIFLAGNPGHRTTEGTATVMDIRAQNVRKPSARRQVRYAYTVNGTDYEQSQSMSVYNLSGWTVGRKVWICYDPKNPKESNLKTAQCDSQTAEQPVSDSETDGDDAK